MKKHSMAIIIVTMILTLLPGCHKRQEDIPNSEVISDQKLNGDNTIVWTVPDFGKNIEDNVNYLNEQLKKDGYDFKVVIGYASIENYQEQVLELLQSGDTDVAFLGYNSETQRINTTTIIQSGCLMKLNDYLETDSGQILQQSFYNKVWETVTVDEGIYTIPNQSAVDGITFAAFNKQYFSNNIDFSGSMEELLSIIDSADIPSEVNTLIWDIGLYSIGHMLGYEYSRGVFMDLKTGEVSCPYETEAYLEYLNGMHTCYVNGYLGNNASLYHMDRGKKNSVISNLEFAVWVGSEYNSLLESVRDDVILLQLPYTFMSRTSGSTGISNYSANQEDALKLLTLLYSDKEYASLLSYGQENITYQIKDGYVYPSLGRESGFYGYPYILGLFDNLLPMPEDYFPIDRKQTKWGLYQSDVQLDSIVLGFHPDLSSFNNTMLMLSSVVEKEKYQTIWKEDNLDLAIEEAVNACKESGSAEVEKELGEQIKKWLNK